LIHDTARRASSRAFYGFGATVTKRMTQNDTMTALVLGRVSAAENRVLAAEKRLNLQTPPIGPLPHTTPCNLSRPQ
jgi:hypothetical protein